MSPDRDILDAVVAQIGRRLSPNRAAPLIVGLCGAQGSGKSTLAAAVRDRFEARDISTAILSIDDLYHVRAERMLLAERVHPLLATRGVPGTHDVGLGLAILDAIRDRRAAPLPRFDKAADDRAPASEWGVAPAGTRLLVFEGWCVGARAQSSPALATPINDLERDEDGDGRWREYVNARLAGDYATLFVRLDQLILLAAPSFETVFDWRIEQEAALRRRTGRGMTDEEVLRFVRHYERVTRHILAEMPSRTDLVIRLDARRRAVS